jgi:hypothetical protein
MDSTTDENWPQQATADGASERSRAHDSHASAPTVCREGRDVS